MTFSPVPPEGTSTPDERLRSDRERLNWLIEHEAYVMEHKTVPRWGVYSSWASLEMLAAAPTPRLAIDAAIERNPLPASYRETND